MIDRKFRILAVNPVNGKRYDESNSLLLCAKDAAVPSALNAYLDECVRIGANPEHIESVALLLERVLSFQIAAGGGRIPDTVGAEIPRCINGKGLEPTGKSLLQLIRQHNIHWEAVAAALGGISCGGVDVPVSEPNSTAGAIVSAIQKISAERDKLRDMEQQYTQRLGEMARLSDIVCGHIIAEGTGDDKAVMDATYELLEYVEAVRP